MRNSPSLRLDRCGAPLARQTSLPAVELRSRALRYLHPLADCGAPRRNFDDHAAPKAAILHSPFRRTARLRRVESVLFLSREPISARKLSQIADLADANEARTLIRRLNALYDKSGRAFRVEEAAGGYLLQTRARFANWIRRCPNMPREMRLSAPTLETLTVIAYRQPVARSEIEAIRGVNCGEILRQLLDRDLVRIAGRSDELGRPYLYETTPKFLQAFGLKRIEDLPKIRRTDEAVENASPESEDSGERTQEQIDHEEIQSREGDAQVSVTTKLKPPTSEESTESRGVSFVNPFSPRLAAAKRDDDDDDEDEEDEVWDDEDEDDDDLDDEEDDLDGDDDLEDDEWEEVEDDDDLDDEEDDEEWDDEEDEEWDDEEDADDDWDDEEEEEEEDDE